MPSIFPNHNSIKLEVNSIKLEVNNTLLNNGSKKKSKRN